MLVWNAMPSITPMMSAIFLELLLMSSIVETTWATTLPPRAATAAADVASWLAVWAESVDWRTVAVRLSMELAVRCRWLAASSVRCDRSELPLATSELATSMLSDDSRTWPTRLRSETCMSASARTSRAGSSRPSAAIGPARSPPAMRVATATAWSSGPQMERSVIHISGRKMASVMPTSAMRAIEASIEPWARVARIAAWPARCDLRMAVRLACASSSLPLAWPA